MSFFLCFSWGPLSTIPVKMAFPYNVHHSTKKSYLCEKLVMLSRFGDIWIDSTYIYTSDWSGSYSEEGPLFGHASPLCDSLIIIKTY